MRKLIVIILAAALSGCGGTQQSARHGGGAAASEDALYNGKVFGVYRPLEVRETGETIAISGETFRYVIDKATGQVSSASALGTEFLADGAGFPNPYVGLIPPNDEGASQLGGDGRARYSFEKAMEMRPTLFSGKLTGAWRYDAGGSVNVSTRLVSSSASRVEVSASGTYTGGDGGPSPSPLSWRVDYSCDVDGFMKVTVGLSTSEPVKLRWHSFLHTTFEPASLEFLARYPDPGSPPISLRPAPTQSLRGIALGEPVLESHFAPLFHLGNPLTGIEFTKEDLGDRWSGYRDSRVVLEDGRTIPTGSVQSESGERLGSHDSRGRRDILTQIYRRADGFELEEFDIRNTTYVLNPDEERSRSFFVQLTPPKLPRKDLNSSRIVWPGPHQVQMVRWRGRKNPWSPPAEELVRQWAAVGVNLIVGGANYFSGDYSHPTYPEKIREFLKVAHSYGMKVIPYVTFSDWNFEAPGYQQHATEWMQSKGIEYAGHTTLMCFGAEGWREHVAREVDALLADFEFDGVYVDHWFHTRFCNNPRHGCGTYLGRFVTEGYHDFARRLRAAVARHTDGQGIMLLNSNNLISSTNLAWFDMRLLGENNDPLVAGSETIASTWNGKRQGVQSSIMWRERQNALDMLNFAATFGFSLRLRKSRNNESILADWRAASDQESELGMNRLYWEVLRFFGANEARMFRTFDSRDVISLAKPGSHVTTFARDGSLLLMMGYQAAGDRAASPGSGKRPERQETLTLHQPAELGLDSEGSYRAVDLAAGGYLWPEALKPAEIGEQKIGLTLGRARLILVTPDRGEYPRLVYFRGADRVGSKLTGGELAFTISAVEGAPVELYIDAGGMNLASQSDGFDLLRRPGEDFAVLTGILGSDKTIKVAVGH
ncbi:MAG: hypothetical protein FVQ81_02930 [Candidatus Glassbacteria bacterium]|nr:hypothetical protein [Candidatus Glassbacteria bacterium]